VPVGLLRATVAVRAFRWSNLSRGASRACTGRLPATARDHPMSLRVTSSCSSQYATHVCRSFS